MIAYLYSSEQYWHFDISIDQIRRPWSLTHFFQQGMEIEGHHEGRPILSINSSNWRACQNAIQQSLILIISIFQGQFQCQRSTGTPIESILIFWSQITPWNNIIFIVEKYFRRPIISKRVCHNLFWHTCKKIECIFSWWNLSQLEVPWNWPWKNQNYQY